MKFKILHLLIFIILPVNIILGWGEEGHMLIARKAVMLLPEEMADFKQWGYFIEEHSPDPDKRKREDKTEDPKHYIDLDYYKEFRIGEMIYNKEKLSELYSDSIVNEIGILPWATVETYKNLVKAFKDKNRDRILIYSSDLAHYVADGHQPMHTILNYDGQLSNQKGLHARYEIHMVNRYLDEIDNSFYPQVPFYVSDPLNFVFYYITTANLVSGLIYDADEHAFAETGLRETEDYYRILWFRTKYITVLQMNSAANNLASLIYSAWTDAGKPDCKDLG
ncbi:MAG: hypothetical protein EHM47_16690 [Ignavibacteriales bacterium]|nr:MAG: hypothetical protein EHM47_16690 [Ignavibacteriales bacterium]